MRLIIINFNTVSFIGGGTGFIGSSLCSLLKGKGYDVVVISRMPGPQRLSWQDLQQTGLPNGTTAVVNLAGQNVLDMSQQWNEGFKQNVRNSRVKTTKALAEAIGNARPKPNVFVTISGVGIYPPSTDKEYTEESEVKQYDFLSKVCHEWEAAAKLPQNMKVRQVTIRSGVVLGRHGGMIKQLYLPFCLGLGGPVLPGNQYLPWIHINDITRLILFAIENPKVEGILNGVAPQVITNKVFSNVSTYIFFAYITFTEVY